MRNKKGIDLPNKWLNIFILGLVVFVVLSFYIKSWADSARGVGEDEKCKTAVEIAARTSMGKDLKECKAVPITIKDSKNKDAVREQLAQTMKRCWDKFGANKKPPLDPFINKKVFCAVCSINTFEGFSEDIDGFALYLAEHNVTGKDETDYEYFYGAPATDEKIKELREDKTKISTKMKFATILYVNKKNSWDEFWKDLGIGTAAGAGVATTGVVVLSFVPGVNVITWTTVIVVGGAAAAGATTGGVIATGHFDKIIPAVMLVPYDYATLSLQCRDLGVDPFESYFS